MTPLLKISLFVQLVVVGALLAACESPKSPTATTDPALAQKESAFSLLFPFEMNSTLSIREQAWEPPFKIKAPPNDLIGFLIVNSSRTPVWFEDSLLNVKLYSYGLNTPNTWAEIPNQWHESPPTPKTLGQPPFSVADTTTITIPLGILKPRSPTDIRIVVVGRLTDRNGQPTGKMVGAFIDTTVIDERSSSVTP